MSFLGQRSDVGEFRRRFRYHAAFVLLVFAAILGRLFFLQIVLGDEYGAAARENVVRRVTLATTRGVVRDAQGHVLASNRPSYNVYAVPQQFVDRRPVCVTKTDTWAKVVDYLRLGVEERARLEKKLEEVCEDPASDPKARKFQQFLVREDVGRDAVAALETHEAELKGVDVVTVPVRYYPYGELGAHTLGYMAEIDREALVRLRPSGYVEGDRFGAAGVERGWESYLRGSRGWEKTLVDARGSRRAAIQAERLIEEPRRLDPVPGRDLRLTLDVELIESIDRAMRGQIAGAAVAVDVRTGRILALYSKPSFDPNVLSGGFGVQAIRDAFRRLYADPLKPTLDKTISGSYPPGSTYKPFSALAALEEKLIEPRTEVDCRGYIVYGKRVFRCTHVHGRVNMRNAIARSCNVYFYQLGDAIGLDRLARMGLEYGFGQKTGLGVNPEAPGRIPTRSWYATHYKGQYHGGFTLNAAIGQGAVTVSVLQLALAYAALANGGTLYQPQIVRAVETSDGAVVQDFPPRVKKRIQLRPENWQLVASGLWGVVNEKEGTAFSERLADVDMAGKTGTAQTSHRRVANEDPGRTWYFNRDHAWFAGYAPSKSPDIAIAVLIEHGGTGGKNAAPVAFAAAREFQRLVQARLAPKTPTAPRSQRAGPAPAPRPAQPRGD
ncbi:MAG: penicillin-binding protein 2 [Polyangiaceae bacterium]|nr:penicillin-binding protein 2 [Polyangiaceae bacterium]